MNVLCRKWFWIFLIGICGVFGAMPKVEATVLSATPYGDSCRYGRATPAGYQQDYLFVSPTMHQMTGEHKGDPSNITVKQGVHSVYAPYDGYVIYVYASHFYWNDANIIVSAPGFSYNGTGFSYGGGGLFTHPDLGCNSGYYGGSKYEVKLSAGVTTFTVSAKNGSFFEIEADKTPPTITLGQTPTTWTNQPITIQASATDPSGVTKLELTNQSTQVGRNFALNGDLSEISVVDYSHMWDERLNGNLIPSKGWTEGINGGVPQPNIGYHAHIDQSLGVTAMMFPNKNGEVGLGGRWLGFAQFFDADSAFGKQLKVGQKITVSFDLYADKLGAGVWGGFHRANKENGVYAFNESGEAQVSRPLTWERKSYTITVDEKWDFNKLSGLYFYGGGSDEGATKWVKNIKVELGDKATPYTKAIEDIPAGNSSKQYQVTANGTYTFTATDGVGNVSTKDITVSNYDNEGPDISLTQTPTTWTNQPITLQASATDPSGVTKLELTNQSTQLGRNFLINGDFSNIQTVDHRWDKTLNGTLDAIYAWGGGYNAGVSQASIGYHAHIDQSLGVTAMKMQNENTQFGLPNRWMGISQAFIPTSPLGSQLTVGQNITVSFDLYAEQPGQAIIGGFYRYDKQLGKHEFDVYKGAEATKVKQWERVSFTITVDENWDVTKLSYLFLYGHLDHIEASKWIKNVKVELGDKATPYTKALEDPYAGTNSKSYQVAGNGTYTFTATDGVGNISTKDITVSNFDNEGPTLRVNASTTTVTKDDVKINVSADDAQSGVQSIRLHHTSIDRNLVGMDDLMNFHGENWIKKGQTIRFANALQEGAYAGIKIPEDFFEEGETYVLSFDMTKIAGDIYTVGGHSTNRSKDTEIYVDGKKVMREVTWDEGVSVPNDTNRHHVSVKFRYASATGVDRAIYIQPNRFFSTDEYEVEIANIQLEKGTVETPYEVSTKDSFTKTNPGHLMVSKNGEYTFVATDKVGNETFSAITVDNIDKEAPTITFTPEQDKSIKEAIEVQVLIEDVGIAGYKHYRYVWTKDETYPTKEWSDWDTENTPILNQEKIGKWYLHIEATDRVGNLAYAYSGPYEKMAIGGPSATIHIQPAPTGQWVTKPITVSILESGDEALLATATKKIAVTNSAIPPATFTTELPANKQVTLSLQGENYVHVQYVLPDGTKLITTNGPYLLDTSTVGALTMYVTDTSGQRVTSWHNQAVRLVFEDPTATSISGVTKQYRIEGYHTEWQPYVPGTMINIEGNTRVLGRIINGAGQASLMQTVTVQLDFTAPEVTSLQLHRKSDGLYKVLAKATDDLSGIEQVVLNNGTRLNQTDTTFGLDNISTKPTSLTLIDRAGNQSAVISFAPEPSIAFEPPYTLTTGTYREEVQAVLTDATGYLVGSRGYACETTPCKTVISYNTTLTAVHTDGKKETRHSVSIANIDRTHYQLKLEGKRKTEDPTQMTWTWNYPLSSGQLRCVEDGKTMNYPVSGQQFTLNGKNQAYRCTVIGVYKGVSLQSNSVTVIPKGQETVNTTKVNVLIEETRLGKGYLINGKGHNDSNGEIPLPFID